MKRTRILSLVLGLGYLLIAGVTDGWTQTCGGLDLCQCGDTVIVDHTLTTDPIVDPAFPCVGNGLTVASGVTLNLGKKTITGTNKSGTGILLQGAFGGVFNGRVQNFNVGIKSDGPVAFWEIGVIPPLTPGSPSGLTVTNNRTGLDLLTRNTTIVDTAATSNLGDGVFLRGGGNTIADITCSKNGNRGLSVQGSLNFLDTNRCELNGSHGISLEGDDNVLNRNYAGRNGGAGLLGVGDGNAFQRNQGRTNSGAGVRGIGANLATDRRNYGTGNGTPNCLIDGFTPTGGGRYC